MKICRNSKYIYVLVSLLIITIMTGCSGLKPYPNNLNKNLSVTTKTDSGSLLSSVSASVDIYKVNSDCSIKYRGTLDLDKTSVDIGISTDHPTYLVFVFATSGLLSNSSSTTFNTLLKAKKNYIYSANVTYMDDLYNVEVKEISPKTKKSYLLEDTQLINCNKLISK